MSRTAFARQPAARNEQYSSVDLARRRLERRAAEAAIWGMPMVNFDAMRQAYLRDAGAKYNDLVYWSKPMDWMGQITTPNNSTNYVILFVNLKDGPVAVDIPAADGLAFYGTFTDAWSMPVADVGSEGMTKDEKYALLPPDHEGDAPAGYIPVRMKTYNLYSLFRLIPRTNSPEDREKALAYLRRLRIYPLSQADAPPATRCIDMTGKPFEAIPPHDATFFNSLARMTAEEPAQEKDLAIMGQLRTLGIGKDLTFRPDAGTRRILDRTATEAHAGMADDFSRSGIAWWPNRQWRYIVDENTIRTKARFIDPGKAVLLDERAAMFYAACAPMAEPKAANIYLKTHTDGNGDSLDGSREYRLHVPPGVPAGQFWSVSIYDVESAGFIREAPVVGLNSYSTTMRRNADGSTDIHFGPRPPENMKNNWISTTPGRPWFALFRLYGPQKAAFDKSWVLENILRMGRAS